MSNNTKMILGIVAVTAVVAIVAVVYFGLFAKSGPVANVDSAGLRKAVAGGATLIDVRTPEEYASGHIAGAILMPDYDAPALMKDLSRDKEYVIYCRTGNRSSGVVKWMAENGFTDIKHLNHGIVSWDGELVKGSEPGTADTGDTPGAPSDNNPAPGGESPAGTGTSKPPASDVSKNDLMKGTDGRLVLVEFATRT